MPTLFKICGPIEFSNIYSLLILWPHLPNQVISILSSCDISRSAEIADAQ